MKVISVKHIRTEGTGPLDWRFFVEVEIESGFLFKKTHKRQYGRPYVGFWRDLETGEYAKDSICNAIKAFALREGLDL